MTFFRDAFDLLFPWIILVSLSLFSWIYVLKPSARRRYDWLTWRFLRGKKKEQKEFENGLDLAVFLIAALASTTVLVFILIFGLVAYLKP